MRQPNIIENDFRYDYLESRYCTDKIVIHHTGSIVDTDLSAEEIHKMHRKQGYVGIGYHFVIRKSGAIERGRPQNALGAHCYGENHDSLGIHLCGNFDIVRPTARQIESVSMLCAYLCEFYNMAITENHIFGHSDFNSTACPGKHLYAMIPTIIGKANYYAVHGDTISITIESDEPISAEMLRQVADIFRESQCPAESLGNTFENFASYKDNVVKFGAGGNYVQKLTTIIKNQI